MAYGGPFQNRRKSTAFGGRSDAALRVACAKGDRAACIELEERAASRRGEKERKARDQYRSARRKAEGTMRSRSSKGARGGTRRGFPYAKPTPLRRSKKHGYRKMGYRIL